MSENCIRKTLATFPYGNIQECSCGGYYVTFGYVTLRLSHKELESYAATLNEVLEGINREAGESQSNVSTDKKAPQRRIRL